MSEVKKMSAAADQSNDVVKMIGPRAEIDTSPPFASVEEAVTRFGGRGPWIPLHLLRLASHNNEVFDMDKMEEQATQLEKDLMLKEQETLNVLKELEGARRFVEDLKLNLMREVYSFLASPDFSSDGQFSSAGDKSDGSFGLPSPNLILTELNLAKSSLSKTTNDLAVIRAAVDTLNRKMRTQKAIIEKGNRTQVPRSAGWFSIEESHVGQRFQIPLSNAEMRGGTENDEDAPTKVVPQLNFEAEQFRNMTEAARYEVVKAMSEIERTKNTIDMVEMRLVAARKIEEAARAVEAIALAERRPPPVDDHDDGGSKEIPAQNPEKIILSFEEYSALAHQAQKAEEFSKKTVGDAAANSSSNIAILRKFEETTTTEEIKHSRKALQQAMEEIGGGNRRKVNGEEGFCRLRSEHAQFQHPSTAVLRNSNRSDDHRGPQSIGEDESRSRPILRSTVSIGDVLSRKLIVRDDVGNGAVDRHTERREVSLSQMLREQSGLIFRPRKTGKDETVEKRFYTQRKKFGFIHVSIPRTRQSRKKTTA